MLGIADRGLVWELFETVLRGDAAGALKQMDALYQGGADPQIVLQDLLDLTHFVTRLKLAPDAGAGDPLEEGDRERARPLAEALSMPVLTRAWQMLLKGIEEVQAAPVPAQAAAMVLIRLAYVADLPVPADLVRAVMVQDAGKSGAGSSAAWLQPRESRHRPPSPPSGRGSGRGGHPTGEQPLSGITLTRPAPSRASHPRPRRRERVSRRLTLPPQAARAARSPPAAPALDPPPQSFAEVVALFERRREALLRSHLVSNVHLVSFEPGRIEFRPAEGAPRDLANRLGQLLGEWTGMRWVVAVSQAAGAPTLATQAGGAGQPAAERGGGPPVGPCGAGDFSGGDDRFRAGPGRGGRSRRRHG